MKITVDNFELRLDINKVEHFDYENDNEGSNTENFTVHVRYILNGEEIKAPGSFPTISDMVKYGITNLNKLYKSHELCPYQMEIFTCTCGFPGCMGIHYPIGVKERRYVIEWRVPRNSGYDFLSSTFYTFSRPMYYDEMKKIIDVYMFFVKTHPNAILDVI